MEPLNPRYDSTAEGKFRDGASECRKDGWKKGKKIALGLLLSICGGVSAYKGYSYLYQDNIAKDRTIEGATRTIVRTSKELHDSQNGRKTLEERASKAEETAKKKEDENRQLKELIEKDRKRTEQEKIEINQIYDPKTVYFVRYNPKNLGFETRAEEGDEVVDSNKHPYNLLFCGARYNLGKRLIEMPESKFIAEDAELFKKGKMEVKLSNGKNMLWKIYDQEIGKNPQPVILEEKAIEYLKKYFKD